MQTMMANARGLTVVMVLNCDRVLGLCAVAAALAAATYFGLPAPR